MEEICRLSGLRMKHITFKFTGDVWARMKTYRMDFSFEGATLSDLLDALFEQYDLRDLILDANRRIIPYSRVIVNGHFSEFVGGLTASVQDGDEVVLIRPFLVM